MSDEPRWRRYLRFRGPDIHADIDDELRFHIDMRERDLLAEGKTPGQAREEALTRFGDLREVRDWLRKHDGGRQYRKRRAEILDEWLRDIRYGLRKLRQQPGFTAAVVLVLALGIGATTAVFSAVDAVLLRPLPFADDTRLVRIERIGIPYSIPGESKAAPDITDLALLDEVFTHTAAYAPGGMNLTGTPTPLRVRIAAVTPGFFSTLGVSPAIGRAFAPEEGLRGAAPVAILSDALWRQYFGGDPAAVGREVSLNGHAYRVVGVMPRSFAFPSDSDLWFPMVLPRTFADFEPFGQILETMMVGRLAPGVTVTQAGERVRMLHAEYPSSGGVGEMAAEDLAHSLRDTLVGDRSAALLVLFGATALVLLVACANVATLLLSRAAARRREMTMRSVLGATRGRIMRQLLVESMLLAGIGGALGIVIARSSLGALTILVPPDLVGATSLRIDGRVLLFTLVLVVLTGITFGLWPALGTLRANAGGALRMGGTGSLAGGETSGVRRLLVVAELALALMLLIGAGVMLRSLHTLLSTASGVQPERVATLEVALASGDYEGIAERQRFMRAVLERLQANPRFDAAALVNELPLRGQEGMRFSIAAEGRPRDTPEERVYAQNVLITSGYFRAMGIPMLRGRTLSPSADAPDGSREVVINQDAARVLWPGEEALGKRLLLPGIASPFEVVGIVGNVSVVSIGDEATPQMYLPLLRTSSRNLALVARGRITAERLSAALQEAVRSAAPGQAVYNVRMMEEVISSTVAPRRTNTLLISLFGALALGLAAVGVYGVIAYAVARRTREIGIRIALGAHPRRVVRHVMREGFLLTLTGIALGLAGAWMLTRVLAGLVYGVSPRDPLTFVLAPTVLLAIAALASLVPARRAARVDPATVMKAE